jgi:hypothetical protein
MILSSYERLVVSLGIPRFLLSDLFLNLTFFGLRFLSLGLSDTTSSVGLEFLVVSKV